MMKKIKIFFTIILASTLFTSCVSNKIVLSDYTPMAVLSVRGNQSIPWKEERDEDYQDLDGVITSSMNKLFGKSNPEIQTNKDRINYADERFAYLLEENVGISVVPKENVINAENYKSINQSVFAIADTKIYADDYKKIEELSNQKTKLLLRELNAGSSVFITFTFNKIIVEGSKLKGTMTASVTMDIDIYDNRGRQKLMDSLTAESSTLLEISKDKYDKDALVELFPDLIDLVINQFAVKYL